MEEYRAPDISPDAFVSARIDIRKFSQFLFSHQINATNVVCSMWFICLYVFLKKQFFSARLAALFRRYSLPASMLLGGRLYMSVGG